MLKRFLRNGLKIQSCNVNKIAHLSEGRSLEVNSRSVKKIAQRVNTGYAVDHTFNTRTYSKDKAKEEGKKKRSDTHKQSVSSMNFLLNGSKEPSEKRRQSSDIPWRL